MIPEGFVLAGGRGRRMGVDKARVPFPNHQPMALHMASVMAPLCTRIRLVRRPGPDPMAWPGIEVVTDGAPDGDAHPLWGVAAALEACQTSHALMVPCDLPWLRSVDLRQLLRSAGPEGAVATDGSDRLQPLVLMLSTSWARRAVAWAREGRSARSFVDGLPRVALEDEVLRNLNHWSDAGRTGPIERLLEGLPFLEAEQRTRVAAGERGRLASLGIIDPQDPVHSTGDTSGDPS